jgi:hypothetical protein
VLANSGVRTPALRVTYTLGHCANYGRCFAQPSSTRHTWTQLGMSKAHAASHGSICHLRDWFNSFLLLGLVPLQSGTTALHYAAMQDHLEVVVALVKESWSVNACDKVWCCSVARRVFHLRRGLFPKWDHCILQRQPLCHPHWLA